MQDHFFSQLKNKIMKISTVLFFWIKHRVRAYFDASIHILFCSLIIRVNSMKQLNNYISILWGQSLKPCRNFWRLVDNIKSLNHPMCCCKKPYIWSTKLRLGISNTVEQTEARTRSRLTDALAHHSGSHPETLIGLPHS